MYTHALKLTASHSSNSISVVQDAIQLLTHAKELCKPPFARASILSVALDYIRGLLRKEWYEEVTAAERTAIKSAMVSGRGGTATHSGHWCNCENGHPFAIGEYGMAMEEARCPECGAIVGGQRHTLAEGVTRPTGDGGLDEVR
ncbi:hypothetical protein JHW43_009519 [Diplocarpon mali]|nr:hypothetical protein JHW43_009519 [Diplocarpon mali]